MIYGVTGLAGRGLSYSYVLGKTVQKFAVGDGNPWALPMGTIDNRKMIVIDDYKSALFGIETEFYTWLRQSDRRNQDVCVCIDGSCEMEHQIKMTVQRYLHVEIKRFLGVRYLRIVETDRYDKFIIAERRKLLSRMWR